MAPSAVEYFASIWNNERGLVPLLFILGVVLTIAIGLGFWIYHCGIYGRTNPDFVFDLDLDLEKAVVSRETATRATQPSIYPYLYSRTPEAGDTPLPSPRPHPPRYTTCECSVVYGPCHSTRIRDRHIIESIDSSSARPDWLDDPPAYEELMAFGRAKTCRILLLSIGVKNTSRR